MQRGRRAAIVACLLLCVGAAWARDVSVGVLGLFHPKTLHINGARASWVVVSGCGWRVALDPDRGGATVTVAGNRIKVVSGEKAESCDRVEIASREGTAAEFELGIRAKIRRTYHGIGTITTAGGELVPVVRMELESAVASVVAAESEARTPMEALKAQAIAARSYFVAARAGHAGFDFCDTTHCQFVREAPARDSAAARATAETRGMVIGYSGTTVAAMYSRSCGGRTRTLEEIGAKSEGYPYFAVDCPYCRKNAAEWRRKANAPRSERERIAVGREQGWSAVPGNNYRIVNDGGDKILEGHGSGHGVGLCQQGAAAMARDGKTYVEILAHYYPNTTIATLHDER